MIASYLELFKCNFQRKKVYILLFYKVYWRNLMSLQLLIYSRSVG